MNNDTAIVLMLADRQRDIEGLRSQVQELEQENAALRKLLETHAQTPSA